MRLLRKTTLVICVLIAALCVFGEKASAQFIAGSYGAGLSPWFGTVPNAHGSGIGFTRSPDPIYAPRQDGKGNRVIGSYNSNTGELKLEKGYFMPQVEVHGYRNGQRVVRLPMSRGAQNRQQRRYKLW